MGSFQLPSQPPFQNLSRRNSQLSLGSTDDRAPRLRSRRSDLGEDPRSPRSPSASFSGSRSRAPSLSRTPSSRVSLSPSPSLDRGRAQSPPPRGIPSRSSSLHHRCGPPRPQSAIFYPSTPESPSLNASLNSSLNAAVHGLPPQTPTPGSRRRNTNWGTPPPGSSPAWSLRRSATSAADGSVSGGPYQRHSMLILDDPIPLGLAPSPLPPMPEHIGEKDFFHDVAGAAAKAAMSTPATRAGSIVSSVDPEEEDDDDKSARGGDVSSVGSVSTYPSLVTREGSLKSGGSPKQDDTIEECDETSDSGKPDQINKIDEEVAEAAKVEEIIGPEEKRLSSIPETPEKSPRRELFATSNETPEEKVESAPSTTTATTIAGATTTTVNKAQNTTSNMLYRLMSALVATLSVATIILALSSTDPVPLTAIATPVSLLASTTRTASERRSSPPLAHPADTRWSLEPIYRGLNTTSASALVRDELLTSLRNSSTPLTLEPNPAADAVSLLFESLTQVDYLTKEYENRIFWLDNLVRFHHHHHASADSSYLGSWLPEAKSRADYELAKPSSTDQLHLRANAAIETLYTRYETVCHGDIATELGEDNEKHAQVCAALGTAILPGWKSCVDRFPSERYLSSDDVWKKPLFLGGSTTKKPKQGRAWEFGERCVSLDIDKTEDDKNEAMDAVVVTRGSAAHRLEALTREWEKLSRGAEAEEVRGGEEKEEAITEMAWKVLSWGVWKVRRVEVWWEFGA